MKTAIDIAIVSDVVCPWCYMGNARLHKAMEQLQDEFTFTVQYHPFQLNPEIPMGGVEAGPFYAAKFGGAGRRDEIFARTTATAHADGLPYNMNLQQVAPNTLDAHRLLAFAARSGRQLDLVVTLFKAYFAEGGNLCSHDVLANAAARHGLDRAEVLTFLAGNDLADTVQSAMARWRELGISSVPSYIVQNKYLIQGAQSPETFVQVLREVRSSLHVQDN